MSFVRDYPKFKKVLMEAAQNIEQQYFHFPVAGAVGKLIYRERVYCYEFYHQMRSGFGNNVDFVLQGETDKSGHPIIKESNKPDFLFHEPGTMTNFVVMEVKPINAKLVEMLKDAKTLKTFLDKYHYQRSIFWLFGAEFKRKKINKILNIFQKYFDREYDSMFSLFYHFKVGKSSKIYEFSYGLEGKKEIIITNEGEINEDDRYDFWNINDQEHGVYGDNNNSDNINLEIE